MSTINPTDIVDFVVIQQFTYLSIYLYEYPIIIIPMFSAETMKSDRKPSSYVVKTRFWRR
jgi:hypothetical protein